jgi:SAM-dependent methyltransferase
MGADLGEGAGIKQLPEQRSLGSPMINPIINWHQRFLQQALWTKPLRGYLFRQTSLTDLGQVLEVGCGTGALLGEVEERFTGTICGLDLDFGFLRQAAENTQRSKLIQGNAFHLPLPTGRFDLVYCHFLLLWVSDPLQVIREMKRVTCPGGHIMALAEPDYGGRIDYPDALALSGKWQIEALQRQGADPQVGRKLAELFLTAGLKDVQTGLLGGEWRKGEAEQGISEWDILDYDLQYLPAGWDRNQADRLKNLDRDSRKTGARVLYIPMFYAWGRK